MSFILFPFLFGLIIVIYRVLGPTDFPVKLLFIQFMYDSVPCWYRYRGTSCYTYVVFVDSEVDDEFYSLKTAAAESILTSTTTARIEDETTSPQPLIVRPEPQVRMPSAVFVQKYRIVSS